MNDDYHLGIEAFISKACWVCIHTIDIIKKIFFLIKTKNKLDIKLPYHIIVTHPKHLVTIWSYLVFKRNANFSYFIFFTKISNGGKYLETRGIMVQISIKCMTIATLALYTMNHPRASLLV